MFRQRGRCSPCSSTDGWTGWSVPWTRGRPPAPSCTVHRRRDPWRTGCPTVGTQTWRSKGRGPAKCSWTRRWWKWRCRRAAQTSGLSSALPEPCCPRSVGRKGQRVLPKTHRRGFDVDSSGPEPPVKLDSLNFLVWFSRFHWLLASSETVFNDWPGEQIKTATCGKLMTNHKTILMNFDHCYWYWLVQAWINSGTFVRKQYCLSQRNHKKHNSPKVIKRREMRWIFVTLPRRVLHGLSQT